MTGTLDLCSHRLDAWITSFATKRLAEMRKANPTGVLFGGYGWVMNLKPAAAQTTSRAAARRTRPGLSIGQQSRLHPHAVADAGGHRRRAAQRPPGPRRRSECRTICWPSICRRSVCAWRRGCSTACGKGSRSARCSVTASSAACRKPASRSSFRSSANLRRWWRGSWSRPTEPVETIAANNVVDGLELQRRGSRLSCARCRKTDAPALSDACSARFRQKPPQARSDERAKPCWKPNSNALADSVDAVSDALMAESVHQVVRGNPLRAASTVESIAGGETPPPELEVVRTPRTGIALTHRLVTLFSGDPPLPPEWAPPANPFRANAEPHLNAWAAKLLGNPAQGALRGRAARPGDRAGVGVERAPPRRNCASRRSISSTPSKAEKADSRPRSNSASCTRSCASRTALRPVRCCASIPAANRSGRPTEFGYGEFSELLRTARKLITGARAIDADDLNLPERSTDFSVDVAELEQRADGAEQSLRRTPNDFQPAARRARHGQPGGAAGIDPAFGQLRRGRRRAALRRWRFARGPPDAARAGGLDPERARADASNN